MTSPTTAMGAVVPEQLAAHRDERARNELQPWSAATCDLRASEQKLPRCLCRDLYGCPDDRHA